jgi:cytochrome P450
LLLLAQHPDTQQRLAAELDVLPADGPLGWAQLPALPYTRAVVDEALRLYPPAWVITRRALDDDVVDGVAVPAGTLVVLSPWLLHRRPESWPDPLRFDPERFTGNAVQKGTGRGPARGDYIPFGAGPRLCIGRDVALVQAVLILAALLRGRTVERPHGSAPVRVDALVTLRPRGGLPLRLLERGGVCASRVRTGGGRGRESRRAGRPAARC